MMGRTHAMGGVAALWLLTPIPGAITLNADATNVGVLALCALLGGLFPDLDAGKSLLSTWSIGKTGIAPFALASALVKGTFGHRGFLHSFTGMGLSTILVGWPLLVYLGPSAVAAFAAGFLSHLFLDCMTIQGLPLLWPNGRKVWMLPPGFRVRTNTADESPVFFLVSMLAASLVLRFFSGMALGTQVP